MAARDGRAHFIPDILLYPNLDGKNSEDIAVVQPNELPPVVKRNLRSAEVKTTSKLHGNTPAVGKVKQKSGSRKKQPSSERPSQLVCADILFLESVVNHIKQFDPRGSFAKTIVNKLNGLIRQKLRSLSSTGTGSCVEDTVDLLLSRVTVLQRTVMDKHWDELQALRMPQGRHPDKEHPVNPRGHRRRYEDGISYSPEEMRSARRDSYESDDLSSAIDRFDRFINQKYRDELREVRKNSMPRLHRRQSVNNGAHEQTLAERILRSRKSNRNEYSSPRSSVNNGAHEQTLAERILRSRKSNRNEYSSPRSISGMRQMVSPDSVYSHVSATSAMKGFIGYDKRDGPNRSPPDGGSYHEEILDIVASVNGKSSHVLDKGKLSNRKSVDQGMPVYRADLAKMNGHLKREDLSRERHYPEERPMGFPQLDQPYQPYSQSNGEPPAEKKGKATFQRTRSVATQSDLPANVRDKKKKKKGVAPSPRTNRTSWMNTVCYDQRAPANECHCDRHKKRDGRQGRKRADTTKRQDAKPRHSLPGDIPRPRVHDAHGRFERDPRQTKDADMELTAMEEFNRKYESRIPGQVPRRRQPSPHNGEKIFDYNIVKTQGYYSDIEEDYIRQYRSLQL